MYSMVLMAALTTSVDLPDLGRRGGCCGCYGGCHGGRGGRRGRGCCGCYGGGYGGCYGGYGMGMGYGGYGCMGCGGYGMGMGYGGYGCMGCGGFGMGMGYGGYGCMGCGGFGGYGIGGGILMPGTHQQGGEKIQQKPKEKTMIPAPATIVVDLPADAKLLIDNEATTSTGSSRVFQSPTLNPGKEYHYTLKAEIVREGKPVKVEQVVKVEAGETTPVKLTIPAVGVAQR